MVMIEVVVGVDSKLRRGRIALDDKQWWSAREFWLNGLPSCTSFKRVSLDYQFSFYLMRYA